MSAPLTIRVLSALNELCGTSTEIAAELDVFWKDASGCLSNMRKAGLVNVQRQVRRPRGYAFLYEITADGERRLAHYRRLHPRAA